VTRILENCAGRDIDVFNESEATALSRAALNSVKATTARPRRCSMVSVGMPFNACRISSMVGTGRVLTALAIRSSFAERLK